VTPVGAGKAVTRPAVWFARTIARGLTTIGLSWHCHPHREADLDDRYPAGSPDPAPDPRWRDDMPSVARLTPDELLWQAELEQGGPRT